MIDTLQSIFFKLYKKTPLTFKRYMHERLDMSDRLIGIIGSRGVGKTTFILQHLKMLDIPLEQKLYFAADHFEVFRHSLYEVAEAFAQRGGKVLAIDEIHKYPDFERELKSIYDTFDLQVIFSGSSALQLEHAKADLSRRAVLYRIGGMSFREYIAYETGVELEPYALDEVLGDHVAIALRIGEQIKPMALFGDYLRHGYYPFYKQNKNLYLQKLNETVGVVLESDLPMIFNIEPKNIYKLKKLLSLLCISEPYELNITKLSAKIEINRNTLYHYLHYLEAGGLITMVKQITKGDGILTKPEKLYLANTNLSFAYCDDQSIDTIREQFFVNQLGLTHRVHYAKSGDFLIDGKYLFEVGGKNKSFDQIRDLPDSFIAADDIEVGSGHKIPLWLFGFLY